MLCGFFSSIAYDQLGDVFWVWDWAFMKTAAAAEDDSRATQLVCHGPLGASNM